MTENSEIVKLCVSELNRRKAKNPSYSLRAYARDLGISPSYLSKIISGRFPVTDQFVRRLLKNIHPHIKLNN